VASVCQIAALEISAKQNGATKPTRPLQKTNSQSSVSKLTKFAAPHPFPNPKLKPSAAKPKTTQSATKQSTSTSHKKTAASSKPPLTEAELDIGKYDGGFEIENEKCGKAIQGEAALELERFKVSLDIISSFHCPTLSQNVPYTRMALHRL
jgi:hypothetical protein